MESASEFILNVTVILGIVHGLVLVAVLWISPKGNRSANRLLSALILVLVWHHLQSLSISLHFYRSFPHFFGADHGSLLLFGPLFFLYTRKATNGAFQLQAKHLLHFLPYLMVTAIDPVIFMGTTAKVEAIQTWLSTMRYNTPEFAANFVVSNVLFFLEFVHVIIYVGLSSRLHDGLRGAKSPEAQVQLAWLRKLTVGFGVVLLVSFLLQRLLYIVIHYYSYSFDYVYIVPMTVFIYAIGIMALRQPHIYHGHRDKRNGKKKYESSPLSQHDLETYSAALLRYMEDQRPYLKPNLKLAEVATGLDIHPNHLSQVINERLEESFLVFINGHRVEDAKRLLAGPETKGLNVLEIAYRVGFNNKTSFNAAFKGRTGVTPTAFRKAQAGTSSSG